MDKKVKVSVHIKNNNEKIDGVYYHNSNPDSQVVLILHGDDDNYRTNQKFLNMIFDSFMSRDFSTLMVNFSKKDKNNIRIMKVDNQKEECELEKETEEATVALNWIHEKNFESKDYWICSIGNGTVPTLQLVMRRPEINNYILLDPIIKKDELNFIVPCLASGMIFKSESNIEFTEEKMNEIQEKLITKTESQVESEIIFDNDKNIDDTIEESRIVLNRYIDKKQREYFENNKILIKDKKRRRRKKKHIEQNEFDVKIQYTNPIKPLDLDSI